MKELIPHSRACADPPSMPIVSEPLYYVQLSFYPCFLGPLPRSSLLLFKLSLNVSLLVFLCSASYDLWISFPFLVTYFLYLPTAITHSTRCKRNAHLINHRFCTLKTKPSFLYYIRQISQNEYFLKLAAFFFFLGSLALSLPRLLLLSFLLWFANSVSLPPRLLAFKGTHPHDFVICFDYLRTSLGDHPLSEETQQEVYLQTSEAEGLTPFPRLSNEALWLETRSRSSQKGFTLGKPSHRTVDASP